MDFNSIKFTGLTKIKKENNKKEECKTILYDNNKIREKNSNQLNFNNNFKDAIDLNDVNIRKVNNLISMENKSLKLENKELENIIQKTPKRVNSNNSTIMKKNFKNMINNNNLLTYKILNEIRDINLLNNNILKNTYIYNSIRMDKLNLDKIIFNNKKEELELKKIELKNKMDNLQILYNSVVQKKNNDKEIISKLKSIVDQLNYENNYINNTEEAYAKMDLLLNEKQKLIEEKINTINTMNNIDKNNKKKNNIEEEELTLLKNKNIKLKNKLNKYDVIIKKTNILMENSEYKNTIISNMNIDNQLAKVTQENENLNNEIENVINKYKKIIKEKNKIFEKLKNQYIQLNKGDIVSTDNLLI